MPRSLKKVPRVCLAAPEFALRKFHVSDPSSIFGEVHSFRRKFRKKRKEALRFFVVLHQFSAPLDPQSEKTFPVLARK
jgi:hypothetical protein